jgi:hypothetical protein
MVPAEILGFNQGHARRSGESSAHARSGDPAANDQYVAISHIFHWLRFGKPRRLDGTR